MNLPRHGGHPENDYSRTFKLEAVKLVTEKGHSMAAAARSLNIDEALLRSWKLAFEKKKRRGRTRRILRAVVAVILAGLAVLVVYALTAPLSVTLFGMGEGSPAYAEKWRARLDAFTDPDAAHAAYPEVEVLHFDNGEWVMGVSDDSHASHWGGTVVVKDSTGRVRVFFGHVCGSYFLSRLQRTKSLADFYGDREWQHWSFREHPLP